MLGGLLDRAGVAEQVGAAGPGNRLDGGHGHLAGGDRPGLVQDHGVDGAGGLQGLVALDEDAELGAAAGGHHQGGRGGQAERARAGDDQHGQGGAERVTGRAARQQPAGQRQRRAGQHATGRTPRRSGRPAAGCRPCRACACSTIAIRCASWVSLPTLSARTTRRPVSAMVPPVTLSPDGGVDRDGLAGHHAPVHGGLAGQDLAVGGDPLSRPDHETLADPQQVGRDAPLGAVVAEHAHVLGPGRGQVAHGLARRCAGPGPRTAARPAGTWSPRRPPPGRSRRRRRAAATAGRRARSGCGPGRTSRRPTSRRRPGCPATPACPSTRRGAWPAAARPGGTATPPRSPPARPAPPGTTASRGTATRETPTARSTGRSAGRRTPAPGSACGAAAGPRPRRRPPAVRRRPAAGPADQVGGVAGRLDHGDQV